MSRSAEYADTRDHLLATGEHIIIGKGFAAVGLAEILGTAGVPKGSFYHYFRSKEGFGVAMLERYFDEYDARLVALLRDGPGTARDRLLRYFDLWRERHCHESGYQGCLAVKLSGEVSDLSEPMREALAAGMNRIVSRLADTLAAGQQDGSVSQDLDAAHMADVLYSLWIGSALLFKVRQNGDAFDRAMHATRSLLPA